MTRRSHLRSFAAALALLFCLLGNLTRSDGAEGAAAVDASSLRGKIMCGYQGWFRCPGDGANEGWVHWSRDSRRLRPRSVSFEMWPDMSGYTASEQYEAPGFSHADGAPATLFSSVNPATVRRHFDWMQEHAIDGAWLQHFVVDLPGGPIERRYASRRRVLENVAQAAQETGRVWALSYDISGMPGDRIYDVLTKDWQRLIDEGVIGQSQYLREGGRPVVQLWGLYQDSPGNSLTPEIASRLIDFFAAPGKYSAFLVGGGDWNWRRNPAWKPVVLRLGAYAPWNVGNYRRGRDGVVHAAMDYWADDRRECEEHGVLWLPVVYPGFSWDNLKRRLPGESVIARREGRFLWEQFHRLSQMGVDSVYVAMFDEVDEGTAIFKVTNAPPVEGHFVGYERLPSDWYLRLVGEAGRRLRTGEPIPREIPIQP